MTIPGWLTLLGQWRRVVLQSPPPLQYACDRFIRFNSFISVQLIIYLAYSPSRAILATFQPTLLQSTSMLVWLTTTVRLDIFFDFKFILKLVPGLCFITKKIILNFSEKKIKLRLETENFYICSLSLWWWAWQLHHSTASFDCRPAMTGCSSAITRLAHLLKTTYAARITHTYTVIQY